MFKFPCHYLFYCCKNVDSLQIAHCCVTFQTFFLIHAHFPSWHHGWSCVVVSSFIPGSSAIGCTSLSPPGCSHRWLPSSAYSSCPTWQSHPNWVSPLFVLKYITWVNIVTVSNVHFLFTLCVAGLEDVFFGPQDQTVRQGEGVFFQCVSGESSPPASITWLKDGTLVKRGRQIQVSLRVNHVTAYWKGFKRHLLVGKNVRRANKEDDWHCSSIGCKAQTKIVRFSALHTTFVIIYRLTDRNSYFSHVIEFWLRNHRGQLKYPYNLWVPD